MDVLTAPETLAAASTDFGRIVRRTPRAVLRPTSAAEVADAVRRARKDRVPLATRGAAHSQSGQSLSDGGIVLDMTALARIHEIAPAAGTARCEAGVLWEALVGALEPHGLTPPVLTNNLNVTIGGTLSMGGLGVASFRSGTQADNCIGLTVVTADGEIVRASPESNRELFDLARCGLGQFGIIVEATLLVRPHRPHVRTHYLLYDDLESLLRDAETLMRDLRCQFVEAWCSPCPQGFRAGQGGRRPFARWFFPLHVSFEVDDAEGGAAADDEVMRALTPYERVHVETVAFRDFARRLEPLFTLWHAGGYWDAAHPWMETILPWSTARAYVGSVLEQLPPHILGGGHILLWPARGTTSTVPYFMTPRTECVLGFGILPGVPPAALPQVLPLLDGLSDASVQAGGKRYLSGRIAFDAARWRAHFGDAWPVLNDAKRRLDPDRILNPGFVAWE